MESGLSKLGALYSNEDDGVLLYITWQAQSDVIHGGM